MTRVFTLIFLILLPFSIQAQQEDEKEIKNTTKRAIVQIKRLKEGALLIRLFDRTKQIDFLNKQGKSQAVIQAYKDKIEKENNEIIEAFTQKFTFCSVYFFYAKDTKHVKNRNFQNVNFVGSVNTNKDNLSEGCFYTADISEARIDTLTHFISYNVRDENDNIFEKRGKKSRLNYEALVIRSDKFIDLLTPFPYSVRTYKDLPVFKRSVSKTVERLNSRLESFYAKYKHLRFDKTTNKIISN